ncbi:phytosulfokine receptor 1-like [Phoenix dactylifera]|uniref:Phytosulfokine receptor 1-like n=1 Tax=Phoenix dactylifera TaxID=42345 RepID=A0A8B7BFG9_PHODC|nr:phytosulfokine receptor 1-like [Phoenix dactylifera]
MAKSASLPFILVPCDQGKHLHELTTRAMKGLWQVLPMYPLFCAIFFISLYSQPCASNSKNLSCNSNDLRELEAFSNGLDSRIDGWKFHDAPAANCCSWPGVRCALFSVFSSSSINSANPCLRVVGLDLASKDLKGLLPNSVSGLDRLSFLNLSHNSLRGTVPPELFHLRRMEVLDLNSNNFTGELGKGISNLTSLSYLDVSFNRFTGFIPDSFHGLQRLESFSAESNRLEGRLPNSLSSCSMLSLLNLRNNSLDGNIDLNFASLVQLVVLNLGSNRFSGHIPKSLSSCRALQVLNLASNNLHGKIPNSFRNLHALSYLSVSKNSLSNVSVALQTLQECQNLTVLILTMNFYGEELPNNGIQGFHSLQALVVAVCALTGSIPSWLANIKELSLLDLSWNHFTGGIPLCIGSLDYLFYLDLSNNSLTGEIPMSLTKLKTLNSDSLSHNGSSSHGIPFFSWKNPTRLLWYKQYMNFPPTVDLSNNMMDGTIWKETGNLRLLQVLDLSNNNFTGSIPDELSGLRNLETLDLSFNGLSGTIPASLVNLTFLSSFNVAHNHLQGQIPKGGQFSTFSSSSFEGNPGLCGEFFLVCNSTSKPPEKEENDREESNFVLEGLPLAMGFISGFLLIVILFSKFCRY